MMFWGDGLRSAALRAAGAALTAVLLASCGGGEQVEQFAPTRIISFGDEASVLIDSGDHNASKYTVNALKDPTTTGGAVVLDCKSNPIWIQFLATTYSRPFSQCNPDSVATTNQIFAAEGAKVADVKTQVDQFVAQPDAFNGKDLVTVLAGANDVLAQYELFKAGSITEAQAVAAVEQAGTDLALQVNRIAEAGGKVLIATVPDMGLTPQARADDATTVGRAAFLTNLTAKLNSKLRIGLINDGRIIGLILLDEAVQGIAKAASLNATDAACTVDVPDCTTLTLVTETTTTMPTAPTALTIGSWMWSDATHLGVGGHNTLGSLAVTRATNNPF